MLAFLSFPFMKAASNSLPLHLLHLWVRTCTQGPRLWH